MKVEVVIASYKDTLQWVSLYECLNAKLGLLEDCVFTIYRTGPPMDGAIMLPNKGREAGQWLAHICQRYDSLADVTIFMQADLGWGTGQNWVEWPHDLNLLKNIRLPKQDKEMGPMDGYSFYTWPNWSRISCIPERECGMTEDQARGPKPKEPITVPIAGPPRLDLPGGASHDLLQVVFGHVPKEIIMPNVHSMVYAGAQHAVTADFIRRLPLEHYQRCLGHAHLCHHFPYQLEFGGWPIFIYDIYRQGKGSKQHEDCWATRYMPSPAG
jgi:hypothetical protein